MNQKQASQPKGQAPVSPRVKSPVEVGGNQGQQPATLSEHLHGTLNFIADSFFSSGNASSGTDNNQDSSASSSNPFAEALRKKQEENEQLQKTIKDQQHLAKHKEMNMTEIFDLDKKKTEESIRQIKEQLNELMLQIKALGQNVNQSVQTAVFQDEVDPGVGNENFLIKLLNTLVRMVKDAKNANNWLQEFHGKKSKSVYQQNSKKYGSQYQFGQEGQGLTRQSG